MTFSNCQKKKKWVLEFNPAEIIFQSDIKKDYQNTLKNIYIRERFYTSQLSKSIFYLQF